MMAQPGPPDHRSGQGWHLPPGRPHRSPHDYEGRLGSGLAMPLRPTAWWRIVLLGLMACVGLSFAALALMLLWSEGSQTLVSAVVVLGAAGASGVYFLIGTYAGLRSRLLADRLLLLTADAVIVNYALQRLQIPWHNIADLRRHWAREPAKKGWPPPPIVNLLSLRVIQDLDSPRWGGWATGPTAVRVRKPGPPSRGARVAGRTSPELDVHILEVDPNLAFALIEFYRDHPEERAELNSVVWEDRAISIARELARHEA